jgi:hypothetical protein
VVNVMYTIELCMAVLREYRSGFMMWALFIALYSPSVTCMLRFARFPRLFRGRGNVPTEPY